MTVGGGVGDFQKNGWANAKPQFAQRSPGKKDVATDLWASSSHQDEEDPGDAFQEKGFCHLQRAEWFAMILSHGDLCCSFMVPQTRIRIIRPLHRFVFHHRFAADHQFARS